VDCATLGDVRAAELRRAAAAMAVADVMLLGFGDSGMEGRPRPRAGAGRAPVAQTSPFDGLSEPPRSSAATN
jgi:LmbE family N-acetylglucosaminyl deacetylase